MSVFKSTKFCWTKILSVFFFIVLLGAYTYIFAIPPTTKYNPGETLDPTCAPGDTNCSVDNSVLYPSSGLVTSTGSAWGTSITGTSSQFVKADGTLDSNSYITGTPWTSMGYITDGNTNWDNSYGFITSYTETDPTVSSYTKSLTSDSLLLSAIKNVDGTGSALDADLLDGHSWSEMPWTVSGSNIYYTAGNVGIGTTSPTSALTLVGDMSITGDITPTADNTYSLGSATNTWKELFVGPGSIYVNGQKVLQTDLLDSVVVSADDTQNLILKTSGGGNIELNPASGGGSILLKSNLTLTAGKTFRTSDSSAVIFSDGISTPSITTSVLNGGIAITPNGTGNTYITSGNFGIGTVSPTAVLHLKAGTATAGTAPLKFTSGTLLTTPEAGAVEFDGTHYYVTIGSTRYQIDQQSGTTPTSYTLNWDSANSRYQPYTTKQVSDPGYAYFYSGVSDPTLVNRINLDGNLYATSVQAAATTDFGIKGSSTTYWGVYGTGTGNGGVRGDSTTGFGVWGQATSGTGVNGYVTTGLPLSGTANPTTTNSNHTMLTFIRSTSGTAANGIGAMINFYIENASGTNKEASRVVTKLTDVTANAEDSALEWHLRSAGTLARKMLLSDNGQLTLDTYGSGTHTGTATKALQVDASGNLIEGDLSGMVYPSSGIAVSTGSAWGTSITGTSSQFVKADGSLDSSTYLTSASLGSYVPYTGATGAIDLGSNNLTIDTNTLFVDSVNHRIGIGTTSPNQQLEITKNFRMPNTTYATQYGIIYKDATPFIHNFNYGNNGTVTTNGGNLFIGINSGNFTMGSTAENSSHSSYNIGVGDDTLSNNTVGFYNSAIGYASLHSNTTGNYNTALGYYSLYANTTGGYNSAVGVNSLRFNTGGYHNSAVGYASLYSNTTGIYNSALGFQSLYSNTLGGYNSAVGYASLNSNTTGGSNTALGYNSLYANKTGSGGVAIGYESQRYANSTATSWANYNTSVGYQSLRGSSTPANNTGNYNTAIGYQTLYSNTTGGQNSASGMYSLYSNTTGNQNSAFGVNSLEINTTGNYNTANGYDSLFSNTTGNQNSAFGIESLSANTTGSSNSAVGFNAGRYIADGTTSRTTGDYGLYLGANSKASVVGTSNEIVIGYNAIGAGSNTAVIGNSSVSSVYFGSSTPSAKLLATGANFSGLTASGVVFTDANKNLTSTGIGTSSQFVKADGSLDSSTYLTSASLGSYVPYTGATGAIDLGSNNLTVDTNTLFVDSVNHRVGIGTTSPTSTLSLVGDMSITGSITPTADNTYSLGSATNTWKELFVGPGSIYVNGQKVLQTDLSDSVVVSADDTQNLILKTTGGGNIELNPASGGGSILLKSNMTVTSGKTIRTSDLSPLIFSDGISTPSITTSVLNGGIAITPNGTGNTYVTSGNFGVGTTAPAYKLQINQATDNNGIRLYGYDDVSSKYADFYINSLGNIYLGGDGNQYLYFTSYAQHNNLVRFMENTSIIDDRVHRFGTDVDYSIGYQSSSDSLQFLDGSTLGTNVRMLINNQGYVGVGIAIPTQLLHVNNGNIQIDSGDLRLNSGVQRNINMLGGGDLGFKIADATKMLIQASTGNVGIGTTSPAQLLHVAGNINIQDGYTLRFNNSANISILGSSSTGLTTTGYEQHFKTYDGSSNYTEYMTIKVGGNVGIGTTSPSAKLSVNNSAYSGNLLSLAGAETNKYGLIVRNALPAASNVSYNFDVLDNAVTYSDVLVLNKNNVGIGTATPSNALVVQKNQAYSKFFGVASMTQIQVRNDNPSGFSGFSIWSGTERGRMQFNASSPNIFFTTYGTIPFNIGTNDIVRLKIDGINGNVGVGLGLDTPTSNFQVGQSTAGAGTITTTAGSTTITGTDTQFLNTFKVGDTITANGETHTISAITSNTIMTTDAWINSNSSVAYTLVGGTRFSVLGNGNVGIGTTAPSDLLSINRPASTGKFMTFDVAGVNKGYVDWDNTNNIFAFKTPSNGRMDFSTGTGQMFFTSGATFFQSATSINRAGDASSTATQRDSYRLNFQSALWNGSAQQLTFSSIRQIASTTVNLSSRLGFFMNGTSSTSDTGASEYLSILSNGNVGVGTTTPAQALEVNGRIRVSDYVQFSSGGYRVGLVNGITSLYGAAGPVSLQYYNGSSVVDGLYLATSGNVGIGTSTPTNKLHIAGTTSSDNLRLDTGLKLSMVSGPSAPTVNLVNEAGNVESGDHYYAVSYVTAIGETELIGSIGTIIGGGNGVKVTTVSGSNQVDVSVTASTDYRVTGIKIYRTPAGSVGYTHFYLVTTLPNTTQTYRDNISDSSLTGNDASFRENTTNYQILNGSNKMVFSGLATTTFGLGAGQSLTTGGYNTFLGSSAGYSVTSGTDNVLIGTSAGYSITSGTGNIGISRWAVYKASGNNNIGMGVVSLFNTTTGGTNIGLGSYSLYGNTTGSSNIAVGYNAGHYIADGLTNRTTGNYGLYLGYNSKASADGTDNEIVVGYNAIGRGSNTAQWGNTSITNHYLSGNVQFSSYGAGTLSTDASGNITNSSDEGLKDILANFDNGGNALDKVLGINPILYKWNDISGFDQSTVYAGFSAQNIQSVIPEAVGMNTNGYLTLSDRPILATVINAIKEMDLMVKNLNIQEVDESGNVIVNLWKESFMVWFGNIQNGIEKFFSKEIYTEKICVKKSNGEDFCIDGDKLEEIVNGGQSGSTSVGGESTGTGTGTETETETEVGTEGTGGTGEGSDGATSGDGTATEGDTTVGGTETPAEVPAEAETPAVVEGGSTAPEATPSPEPVEEPTASEGGQTGTVVE